MPDPPMIAGADWPVFGWSDDIRPPLAEARAGGRAAVVATLYRVEGSAPRGPGAQMLFDGARASGYFSGDCIEGDVARHAATVAASGEPVRLHYGAGSPWIDMRLRCGGALHVALERVLPDDPAVDALLGAAGERRACVWHSGATAREVRFADAARARLLAWSAEPFAIARRFDPPRRLIVSGGDPGALALARLGAEAGFDTVLVRPGGPDSAPPFAGVRYLRDEPEAALARIGIDRWTAYVGATHEDDHDLAGCLAALRGGAGYVAMIGAASRAAGRKAALRDGGVSETDLARLRLSPGIRGLGKAPWQVAVGIVAEIMRALDPAREPA